jgi:hypothetical protein
MTANLYLGGLLLFRLCPGWRKDNNTSCKGTLSRDCNGLESDHSLFCRSWRNFLASPAQNFAAVTKKVRPLSNNFIRAFIYKKTIFYGNFSKKNQNVDILSVSGDKMKEINFFLLAPVVLFLWNPDKSSATDYSASWQHWSPWTYKDSKP